MPVDEDNGDEDSLLSVDQWDRLPDAVRAFFDEKYTDFVQRVRERHESERADDFINDPSLTAEETDEVKMEQRCVRLVDVKMAMHLLTARVCFRSLSAMLEREERKAIVAATQFFNSLTRFLELGHTIARVSEILGWLLQAISLAREYADSVELERKIREHSTNLRAELAVRIKLEQLRTRKRRPVLSRHYSPPQRRPNK